MVLWWIAISVREVEFQRMLYNWESRWTAPSTDFNWSLLPIRSLLLTSHIEPSKICYRLLSFVMRYIEAKSLFVTFFFLIQCYDKFLFVRPTRIWSGLVTAFWEVETIRVAPEINVFLMATRILSAGLFKVSVVCTGAESDSQKVLNLVSFEVHQYFNTFSRFSVFFN